MDNKEQHIADATKMKNFQKYFVFFLTPTLLITHLVWTIAKILDMEVLLTITQSFLLVLIGLVGIIAVYAIAQNYRKHKSFRFAMQTVHPVIRQYNNLIGAIYLGVLMADVVAFSVLPEHLAWTVAIIPALAIVAFIGLTIHFYRLYNAECPKQTTAGTDPKSWEKYWSYLMVSDNVDLWITLTLAVYMLCRGFEMVLSDSLMSILGQLHSAMWIMLPLVAVYELNKLSRNHKMVMDSQPRQNKVIGTTLGLEALVVVIGGPWAKRLIYRHLALQIADTVYLTFCIVVAIVLIGTAIYFKVYKSKYIKASTLSW